MAISGWPFRGREAELALIGQAMNDPAVAGLVVAGEAGVGKTRLALEALERADSKRYMVKRAIATEAARSIRLGALAQLLPADLPPSANPLRAATEALVAVGGQQRLLLGMDDAHLLDDFSAALLHQIVHSGAAFVLLTLRSGEPAPGPITALWKERTIERFDLLPLSLLEAEQVLTAALGGQVDSTTTARLWRATRGNALLLRELVVAGRDQGALTDAGGVWRWQGPWAMAPRLIDLVNARLEHLDEDELHVLELLAYGDPLGFDLLASLTPARAIEALERQGLLWVEQDRRRTRVRPAHPLYVEALRRRSLGLRELARQRELAEAIKRFGARRHEDELQLAILHTAIGRTTEPRMLVSAARQAWVAFDAPLAERLARAALEGGAGIEAAQTLSDLLVYSGRAEEAEELLVTIPHQPSGDEERARLAMTRAFNLFWGLDRVQEALELLAEAERSITSRPWREASFTFADRFANLLLRFHPDGHALGYGLDVQLESSVGSRGELVLLLALGWFLLLSSGAAARPQPVVAGVPQRPRTPNRG